MAATILVLALLFVVQPLVMLAIYCHHGNLDSKRIRRVIGAAYEGYTTKRRSMLLYPLIYFLRIVILAYIAAFLEERPVTQLIIMMYLNLATMSILLLVKPFVTRMGNRKELLGELLNVFMT